MAWITRHQHTTYDWHDVPEDALPTDREIKAALATRLRENLYTQDAEIRIDVADRSIVLHGSVGSPDVRRAAADDAWFVPGVIEVDNRITVAA